MLLENLTILYVEDDQDTQRLIKGILSSLAKEVYVASDGEEGFAIFKQKKPDIVLTDICMPKMDGLEMSKEIKQIVPNQPIGIFTAFDDPEYLKKASELDIGTYILKPFDRKQFFNSLEYLGMVAESQKS
ncbi:diguanylate cyclase/phosphodiesterase (GGDEF & EAL domains) with PAS/PAC sensor(s) [hydrothermal vent metagenome]|uniref:Diguanylate cyclase/phosphodiesterase (GGDEF & EAL domains) with PAS/PAC sensor(S) n=1 Tax=hydrothermal vent metagenome TaxID=652676 RepID=A0A1W1BFD6_9ZZZZ